MAAINDLNLIASGKVREIYDLGDELLLVASDRISTYDAVHPNPIPDKGAVLTAISTFWFERTGDLVPNHLVSVTDRVPAEVRGRAMVVKKLKMLPVEAVVRGYIAGSGWKDYQKTGTVSGVQLPGGLRESDQLPEPIFTPSTKADLGHDEAIDFEQAAELIGDGELAERLRAVSIALYQSRRRPRAQPRDHPGRHQVRVRAGCGRRSSRSVTRSARPTPPASGRPTRYEPGRSQPSFDKQFARDWATSTGWDKLPPAPEIPADVVAAHAREVHRGLRAHHRQLVRRLDRAHPGGGS